MLGLPDGLTWPIVAFGAAICLVGFAAEKSYSERQRLRDNLTTHAKNHPEDAEIIKVLVACNSRILIDEVGCAQKVLDLLGPDKALVRMEKLQTEGAFGRSLGQDGIPAR